MGRHGGVRRKKRGREEAEKGRMEVGGELNLKLAEGTPRVFRRAVE